MATKPFTVDGNIVVDEATLSNSTTSLVLPTGSTITGAGAILDAANSDTDDLSEGTTNLYFTDARADARIALQAGANLDLSGKTTTDLSEGTNLYYTDTRADARITAASITDLSDADQSVQTTDNVTFANITATGYIAGPATFTIDPAAVGDATGTVVILGDLQVDGTTTTINSTTLDVDDLNITVASGAANAAAANGAGLTVDGANATFTYDSANDRWAMNKSLATNLVGNVTGTVSDISNFTTTDIAEGTNLYYTDTRVDTHLNQSNPTAGYVLSWNGSDYAWIDNTGYTSFNTDFDTRLAAKTTTDLAEGTNEYYTSARVQAENLGGSLAGTISDARVQYGTAYSGTPAQGNFFFDSLNQKLKIYTGSAFVDAVPSSGGGGGGGGATDASATFKKYTYTATSATNSVSGKDDIVVTAGDFVTGYQYEIISVGTTDFTAIGASANTVGVTFTATDVGSGTGTAGHVLNYDTSGIENVEVFVNGVKQVEGASYDYVATTGTSVTFTSNLAISDVVDVQVYELLTQDSFYTKTETYTQAEVNTQISTGLSSYLPLAGGTMTGRPVLNYQNPEIRFEDTDTSNNGEITLDNTSLRFESDPDNTVASSTIKFMVDGDTKVTIDDSGNVGIGTTNPGTKLEVNGGSTTGTHAKIVTTGSGHNFDMTDGTSTARIRNVSGRLHLTADVNNEAADSEIRLLVDNSTKVVIDSNGNVGIGTLTPSAHFHSSIADNSRTWTPVAATTGLFERNSVNWVTIEAASTNNSVLTFADESSQSVGSIQYNHPSDAMTFVTNENEAMRIDSSGKVGINTVSPSNDLHVQQSVDTTSGGIQVRNSGDTSGMFLYVDASNHGHIDMGSAGNLEFKTGNTDRMFIKQAGNVSIGSLNNQSFGLFQVNQTTDNDEGGIGILNSTTVRSMRLYVNASDRGVINSGNGGASELILNEGSGNVGIGLADPLATLHVNGNIVVGSGDNNQKIYMEGAVDDLNMIHRSTTENTMIMTSRHAMALIIDSNNDDTDAGSGNFSIRRNGTTVAGSTACFEVRPNGDVGIGTDNSAAHALHIQRSSSPTLLLETTAASSNDAILRLRGSRTTSTAGDFCQILFETNDSAAASDGIGFITAGKDIASTNQGTIRFGVSKTNGGTPEEVLRINSNGNLVSAQGDAFVGTASSSTGTRGSILEQGSNGNGRYIRFADGTQICYSIPFEWANEFAQTGTTWTYPAAFSSNPAVVGNCGSRFTASPDVESLHFGSGGSYQAGTTSVDVKHGSTRSASYASTVVAIGRWF